MPYEGNKDGRHYWLTPPDLMASLQTEYGFDFDACPFPRPDSFDGLVADWGGSTYVNPPFKGGVTAWVRKAIAETEKGKRVVFVFPVDKWILMFLTHPNFKEVRNLKDVKWCATEDGQAGKGMGRHIAQFVLEPKKKPRDFWIIKEKGYSTWVSEKPLYSGDTDEEIHVREVIE